MEKEKYIQLLRYYYYIGGMPEPVLSFKDHSDFLQTRTQWNRSTNKDALEFDTGTIGKRKQKIHLWSNKKRVKGERLWAGFILVNWLWIGT